jgi:hypothetical protein
MGNVLLHHTCFMYIEKSSQINILSFIRVCLTDSVVDPHWFECGSGSGFLPYSGSGFREPTNADPDPGQTCLHIKFNFYMKNVLYHHMYQ